MQPAKSPMQRRCFVISPIGKSSSETRNHSDWVLKYIIEPVFNQHFSELKVERSDKIAEPGMIDGQIINMLIDCELVIADLTTLNPNVFYEIGIRHMIGKPIIHIFIEGTDIPFDVAPYRAISFKLDHPDDLEKAKGELTVAVEAVRKSDYVVENPVTRARGQLKLREHATPQEKVLLDQLNEIGMRLSTIEKQIASDHLEQAQRVAYANALMFPAQSNALLDTAKILGTVRDSPLTLKIRDSLSTGFSDTVPSKGILSDAMLKISGSDQTDKVKKKDPS